MNDSLIICLFCGHEHPSSAENCPNCGRAPIDRRLTSAPSDDPVQLGFVTEPQATAAEPAPPESTVREPVEAEPLEAEPVEAEPVEAEPVEAEPTELAPIGSWRTETEPDTPASIDADAPDTKLPEPESAEAEPQRPEHAEPGQPEPEPELTDTAPHSPPLVPHDVGHAEYHEVEDTSAAPDTSETEPMTGEGETASDQAEPVNEVDEAAFEAAMFAAMTEWPEEDLDWMSPQGGAPALRDTGDERGVPEESDGAEDWSDWEPPPVPTTEVQSTDVTPASIEPVTDTPAGAIDEKPDSESAAGLHAAAGTEPEAGTEPDVPMDSPPQIEPDSSSLREPEPDVWVADESEWFDAAAPDAMEEVPEPVASSPAGPPTPAEQTDTVASPEPSPAAPPPAERTPAAAAVGRPAVTRSKATPQGTRRSRRPPQSRSQSLVVGLVVLAVIVGWFLVLNQISRDDGDPGTIAGSDVVVSTTGQTATTLTQPTATTTPTDDAATTTVAPTTTSTSTLPPVPDIAPVGDPIAVADLGLGAFALGPLDFGSTDALGRLVSTFGEPDGYSEITGAFGLCDGDAGFTISWGPFTALFSGTVDDSVFEGYRQSSGGGDHPAADLTTLSGLAAGDTVADLQSVYQEFIVSLEDGDDGSRFILTRTSDAATLLWGPVSATDDAGAVLGIYSPNACDGGPVPSP